ncbi:MULTISPECIES: MFS transporter [Tsukamurella]|uniref:MFS transporter n=2 Tax=Tsukamurella TaxID=2060 RepID=A0A5C5RWS5_9ACTN|nr:MULTISPECIES: MFS transporter [Tsukamurella]NMD56572.1 MFS transporter [Tsukamurella columbiensis]TWS27497.1 MFS transporter [Tsukamurella conjunctivitidis]
MSRRALPLILAIFAVGTSELIPSGILQGLATRFGVSLATVGLTVTVYALTMAFLGPAVTAVTLRYRRSTVAVALLLVFAAGTAVVALAPTFPVLLLGRVLTASIHGTLMAVVVILAERSAPAGKSGSAVAAMQFGINLATVVGVPLGTWFSGIAGWRWTFAVIGLLGAVASVLIAMTVWPPEPHADGGGATLADELAVLRAPQVSGMVVATALYSAAMFAIITYLQPTLDEAAGITGLGFSLALFGYGIASLGGNVLGGRLANGKLPPRLLAAGIAFAASCALVGLAHGVPLTVAALVFFGVATFALIPLLQTRVLTAAAAAPNVALTANMSAFGVGAAGGSLLGGRVLEATGSAASIAFAAAGLALASWVFVTILNARLRPDGSPETDAAGPGAVDTVDRAEAS